MKWMMLLKSTRMQSGNTTPDMVILGLDPGFRDTGFGIIEKNGNNLKHIAHGSIQTSPKDFFPIRLQKLHQELKALIDLYQPHRIAIERLFFAQNAKTALEVGEARGVLLLTAVQEKKEIIEFTPLQVKLAVSGYGKADKKQIQQMVKILLKLDSIPKPDDAADALAIAICAANRLVGF